MACGVPALVAREGVLPELVRDGKDGFVVEPTEQGVAAAMLKLLDHRTRASMRRSARERALHFTPERRAAALLAVYQSAMAERKARREVRQKVKEAD